MINCLRNHIVLPVLLISVSLSLSQTESQKSDPADASIRISILPEYSEEDVPDHSPILSSFRTGGDRDMLWLCALGGEGDTLWTTGLTGTDEWNYSADITYLLNGGYFAVVYADCWSTYTYTARLSRAGELQWHNCLNTEYLLGIDENTAEMDPRIVSLRETESGDFLASGSVSQWCTDSDFSYVCLLDGDTGDPVWKTVILAMGESSAYDAVETTSGMILAVGTTARSEDLKA